MCEPGGQPGTDGAEHLVPGQGEELRDTMAEGLSGKTGREMAKDGDKATSSDRRLWVLTRPEGWP